MGDVRAGCVRLHRLDGIGISLQVEANEIARGPALVGDLDPGTSRKRFDGATARITHLEYDVLDSHH